MATVHLTMFCKCLSHCAQTLLIACLLILASISAQAQKPKLKLLEYNLPEDSSIVCSLGPYYVEESVQRQPGELVDKRIVYSQNCWSVRVREMSVSTVADEFSMHIGDTVTVETCEYLPDSSRAVLRRFVEANGPCKLRRADASSSPTQPFLGYDIIFDEPTKYGPVADYVDSMNEDRRTVIAVSSGPGCVLLHTSVPNELVRTSQHSILIEGDLRIIEQGEYVVLDLNGRAVAQGYVAWGSQTQSIVVRPGVYIVMTRTSRRQVIVLL